MEKISIIGCGWLGLALAKSLLAKQYQVVGSTTSPDKIDSLSALGITPSLFQLNPMPEGNSFQTLFKSSTVFINIPPASRKNPPEYYREQIKYLKYLLNGSDEVKRVLFISSTSYYPNVDQKVDENSLHDFEKGSSKAVVWAEQEISEVKQQLIILRCGGLLGYDRIPGKYFAGKDTPGKENPTNYIHRDDVIREAEDLLLKKEWPTIKNLVNPSHYAREKIMTAMAEKHDFAPPVWTRPFRTPTKTVCSLYDLKDLKEPLTY